MVNFNGVKWQKFCKTLSHSFEWYDSYCVSRGVSPALGLEHDHNTGAYNSTWGWRQKCTRKEVINHDAVWYLGFIKGIDQRAIWMELSIPQHLSTLQITS